MLLDPCGTQTHCKVPPFPDSWLATSHRRRDVFVSGKMLYAVVCKQGPQPSSLCYPTFKLPALCRSRYQGTSSSPCFGSEDPRATLHEDAILGFTPQATCLVNTEHRVGSVSSQGCHLYFVRTLHSRKNLVPKLLVAVCGAISPSRCSAFVFRWIPRKLGRGSTAYRLRSNVSGRSDPATFGYSSCLNTDHQGLPRVSHSY